MSLPQNLASLRSQFYFTLFYFTTSVFTIVNTILYWFVTLPHNDSGGDEPPTPQPSGLGSIDSPMRVQELGLQQTMMRDDGDDANREPCKSRMVGTRLFERLQLTTLRSHRHLWGRLVSGFCLPQPICYLHGNCHGRDFLSQQHQAPHREPLSNGPCPET